MPLQDHFHPPLHPRRHWTAFHHAWATSIAFDLNRRLPKDFFAEPNVKFGIEIDVAAFENGAGSQASDSWQPGAPAMTVPLAITSDIIEVQVFEASGGPVLAGAIELISPANKDRPEQRDAFLTKCASYLHETLGLIIVDVVTSRAANLHDALVPRVTSAPGAPTGFTLYAAAYRPTKSNGDTALEIWPQELRLGQPLPTMPLWLPSFGPIKVELEGTYASTLEHLRMESSNGAPG